MKALFRTFLQKWYYWSLGMWRFKENLGGVVPTCSSLSSLLVQADLFLYLATSWNPAGKIKVSKCCSGTEDPTKVPWAIFPNWGNPNSTAKALISFPPMQRLPSLNCQTGYLTFTGYKCAYESCLPLWFPSSKTPSRVQKLHCGVICYDLWDQTSCENSIEPTTFWL